MKFWTILVALYGDVESQTLFPSEGECSAAIQPMYVILEASYEDVGVMCQRSKLLSASPRPVARPKELGND